MLLHQSTVEESLELKFSKLPKPERDAMIESLSPKQLVALNYDWNWWARPKQLRCFEETDWSNFLYLCGRGFGKTRTGTEWVKHIAETHPGSYIAVVGPTTQSVNRTLVEGPTGLMNICDPSTVHYQRTKAQIRWKNGSIAMLYALDVNTNIPTPDGFIKMLDLKVGDTVFNEQGKPTKVTKVSPVYLKNKCYELTLKSGVKIIADVGHRWRIRTAIDRATDKKLGREPTYTWINTQYIFDNLMKPHKGRRDDYNIWIDLTKAVDYSRKYLPLDPYTLGAWLGDGSRSDSSICSKELEIMHFIPYETKPRGHKMYFGILGIRGKLKEIGVLKNKHIPKDYLYGDVEQRKELLRGLLDTDGSVSKAGEITFTNNNIDLIEGVVQIVCSLGGWANYFKMSDKSPTHSIQNTKPIYRVHIRGLYDVFKLPRKLERCKQRLVGKDMPVVAIKEVESRPVKCITVDSENHLFLAGKSFIVVGNSAEKPDRLRGPNHHFALADEIVAWKNPETWDMLKFTLRIGARPKTLITTTPKPTDLVLRIIGGEDNVPMVNSQDFIRLKRTIIVRGTTFENTSLSEEALDDYRDLYQDTATGEQELYAKLLVNVQGALFKKDWIVHLNRYQDYVETMVVKEEPVYVKTVIAVDPATTAGSRSDQTGICVASKGEDGRYYIRHCEGYQLSPDGWATEVVRLYKKYHADKVVVEINNGGDMVENTIRHIKSFVQNKKTYSVDAYTIPIEKIHAKKGKLLRAEEVALLYEQRRVTHIFQFSYLESQMVVFRGEPNGADDLVDAMVYAIKDLSGSRSVDPMQPAVIGQGLVSNRIALLR